MTPQDRNEVLGQLNLLVRDCTRCELHKAPGLPVPGFGVLDADLFICAEAPGEVESSPRYHEGEFGVPLIGPAGTKLQEHLIATGIHPKFSVYVTNVLKHRPPGNRPPTDEQKNACTPHLRLQLAMVKPRAVLALGKHAAATIREIAGLPALSDDQPHRGRDFTLSLHGHYSQVFSLYHPSYACLRNPGMEPLFVSDLHRVLAFLNGG